MSASTDDLERKRRVLLVDDEPVMIRALHQMFKDDHLVSMATHGQKALELCVTMQPDLVLLDVSMPGIDGFEVCRRLKADPATSDIAVIFVTGYGDPETETRGLELGAADFVSKPFNPAVVRARVRTQLTLKAQTDLLRRTSTIDGLTGVFNRRYFDTRLDTEWRAGHREGTSLGVVMIDIDHFKAFNDHYGHQAGDSALRAVALQLRNALRRPRDFLARYGGEEFVCLLPGYDSSEAQRVGEYLCAQVEALQHPHGKSETAPHLTISVGAAAMIPAPGQEPASLLEQADQSLYQAKRSGRNRACAPQQPESSLAMPDHLRRDVA